MLQKKRNYWWIIFLLLFDFIYYYFIQHLGNQRPDGSFPIIRLEGLVFVFIISLVSLGCVHWVKKRHDHAASNSITRRYLKMILYSFLLFIFITGTIQFLTEYLMGQQRGWEYIVGNGLINVFLHLIVGNIYIGIEYFRTNAALKEKLILSEKAKTETELKVLQQQMSPHFLFNNLNTLSSLISLDQQKAIEFSNGLANILRYVSQNARKDFIVLEEELKFIDQYMTLISIRFGDAYQLKNQLTEYDLQKTYTIPMSLQIAVENAIKHNKGSRKHPLFISLKVKDHYLCISNEIRLKADKFQLKSGIGLKNLNERFLMQTGKEINTSKINGTFHVRIPILKHILDEDSNH